MSEQPNQEQKSNPSLMEVYSANVQEIQRLVFQTNDMNPREVLGKVYFCLKTIEEILKK